MPQLCCCVTGCFMRRRDGIGLHRFPNPITQKKKFELWTSIIGGEVERMNPKAVFENRRICDKHFKDAHKSSPSRLCSVAFPTLHLPASAKTDQIVEKAADDVSIFCVEKQGEITPNQRESMEAIKNKILFEQKLESHTAPIRKENSRLMAKVRKYESIIMALKKKCNLIGKRYNLLRKLSKTVIFDLVSKNMTPTAKLFFKMQLMQCGKRNRGRRFTNDEKNWAISFYNRFPEAYECLNDIFILPGRKTLVKTVKKFVSENPESSSSKNDDK